MCKYCNAEVGESSDKDIYDKDISLGVYGKDNLSVCLVKDNTGKDYMLVGTGDMGDRVNINYCPMCGRKL